MADNIIVTPGTGATIRADEMAGGELTQVVKIALGADGAEDLLLDSGQQTMAASLPVAIASNQSDVNISLAGEAVVLGAGSASVGTLGANSGVDIGDVTVNNASGANAVNIQDGGNSITVDGPVTDTQLRATAVPVSLASVPSHAVTGPLTDTQLRATAVPVSGTVTASGPLTDTQLRATAVPVSTPTGASSATIQGTVAHDGAVAQNPVQIAGEARSTERAAVASADVARLVTDLVGKLITLPYANPENMVSGATAAITDTTRTSVIAAGGAGVRTYVTQILVTNSHATVGTFVLIEDGTTTLYVGYAAPLGGGFSVALPVPLRGTANTAINVSCVTTGANVRASISGYRGA